VVGMATRQAIEHRGEIALRIEAVQLRRLDDGVDGGGPVATTVEPRNRKFLREAAVPLSSRSATLLSMLRRPRPSITDWR
jgi:hypothetical protein